MGLRLGSRPKEWTMASLIRRHALVALFALAVLGSLAMAAYQLAHRIPYAWDLFIWSESPFLTNILKIDAGLPVFTSPEQVNSFVYSPGLEYLTYALLKPIGRHLDIRYCRAVSVGFAALAALALMRCSILLRRQGLPGTQTPWFAPLSAALFFLVIYHNFTSDVPHPDNLYICHFAVTLMLTFEAILRPSLGRSALAVVFAGLAVLVKQTAAFSVIGVVTALVMVAPRRVRATSWLVPLGVVTAMAALACLWSMGQARFYTFEVLSSHGILKSRISWLIIDIFKDYRLVLFLLYGVALYCGLRSNNRTIKQLLLAHFTIGLFATTPAILAFLKPMGNWNNLTVIEVWAAVAFIPFVFTLLRTEAFETIGYAGSEPLDGFVRATIVVLAFCLVYFYIPPKDIPRQSHYEYCRKIEASVKQDLEAGKRVLVAHGTSFQLRNQSRQIPLDRSNSYLELYEAGKTGLTGTERRVRERYYDKIYLNSLWFSPNLDEIIRENYREVARIPAPVDRFTTSVPTPYLIKYGFQRLHRETPVYEARELPPVASGRSPSIKR
jgi:hypothetical protein